MVKISCQIQVYGIDGKETSPIDSPKITISSKDRYAEFVEISFEGKSLIVARKDLETSIRALTSLKV